MKDLFGEVAVSQPIPLPAAKGPIASSIWKVAGWYSPQGYWKIWKPEWLEESAARSWAERVLGETRGYTHYSVLELKLPGWVAGEKKSSEIPCVPGVTEVESRPE